MVFEFLIVLIISLIFGNGLLFFASNKGKHGIFSLKEQIQQEIPEQKEEILPDSVFVDDVYSLQASFRSANEKIKLAHERITELEDALSSINAVLSSPGKEKEATVSDKIAKFEVFRRNTKIELEAIKNLLKELKEFREAKTKKKVFSRQKDEELNKKIHDLVFNAKKSN